MSLKASTKEDTKILIEKIEASMISPEEMDVVIQELSDMHDDECFKHEVHEPEVEELTNLFKDAVRAVSLNSTLSMLGGLGVARRPNGSKILC